MTGGRVKHLEPFLKDETFMVTYGDGVANVNVKRIARLSSFTRKARDCYGGSSAARFGELLINEDSTTSFSEKPQTGVGWINGGFIVFEPEVFNYLKGCEHNGARCFRKTRRRKTTRRL